MITTEVFLYKNELKEKLTDEKLYNIYQSLMKLKIDTTGFSWWINQEYPFAYQLLDITQSCIGRAFRNFTPT